MTLDLTTIPAAPTTPGIYGIQVTIFPFDSVNRIEVWRAPDNGSGAANDAAAAQATMLPPGPLGGVQFIDPLQNDNTVRYYKSRHVDPAGNVSAFTTYSDAGVPVLVTNSGLSGTGSMAAFGAIVDAPPPNTKYEMRMAANYADPDFTDGLQTYIDFPATTNFMRLGQTPLAIVSSTNTTPINVQITGHGYSTGDQATIRGHLVNTNANGTWSLTRVDNDNVTLNASVGNGVGVNTGHVVKLSLLVAPDGSLTVFGTIIATVFNAVAAMFTGLLSALGGLLVRNSLQHSTQGAYGDTAFKRVLLENDSFKLMGDVAGQTNNEPVRIGDHTVSGAPIARSTTNLNDPASGSRGWNDPESAPAAVVIILASVSLTSWTVPQDWNNANNSIEGIGGGGGGASSTANVNSGAGGGGGEYRKITNLSLTPGAAVTYAVGQLGDTGTAGTDTNFNSGSLIAKAGSGASGATGGAGGTGGTGAGGNNNGGAGGAGGSGTGFNGGAGGGGAGGTTGAGATGGAGIHGGVNPTVGSTGGAGGTLNGGTGGTGSGTAGVAGGTGGAGTVWSGTPATGTAGAGGGAGGGYSGDSTHNPTNGGVGGAYGGGGGGAGGHSTASATGGKGKQGVIVITYTPVADNGINLIMRTSNGASTVAAASRLYQKLGDATEGANLPAYDTNYTVLFKLIADASTFGASAGTVVASMTVEYATDGTGSSWTALGGSWSVTAGGSGSGSPFVVTQVFNPTLVVAGVTTHLWFRFVLTVTTTSGPANTISAAVLKCFAVTYKTDNYAATWSTAANTANRRGLRAFNIVAADHWLLEDGSGAWRLEDNTGDWSLEGVGRSQPHASFDPVANVGVDLAEGELQFVGGSIHSLAYEDNETIRYISKYLGQEINKTTTASSDTKITTGVKIVNGRMDAVGRTLRIRVGGSIGANTGTVNIRIGTANTVADGLLDTLALAASERWYFDVTLVTQATGAPGTLRYIEQSQHGTTVAVQKVTPTFSLTTSADNFINVTGLTTGAVTLTVDVLEVEWLN